MFRQWGDTVVIVCETSTTYTRCLDQKTLVDMARRTFQFNDVDEYITMHHMDLKNVTKVFKPSQYTLMCNPPYFKENQQHQHQKEAHKIARHEIMCTLEDWTI